MKTIFVTGAGGLIGSLVVDVLSKDPNYRIIAGYFSNKKNNSQKNLVWLKTDLRKPIVLSEPIHTVVHCAAVVPSSFQDTNAVRSNEEIDEQVIKFCISNHCRLIYCSSASVYFDEKDSWTENATLAPNTPYSRQKYNSEIKIKKEIKNYVIFRINAPYHPSQKHNTVLKKFIALAIKNEDIILMGSGLREQNFINAEDVAQLIAKAIEKEQVSGVFNAGGNTNISMKEMALMICSSAHSKSKLIYHSQNDPNAKIVPKLNMDLTKKTFDWNARISLQEGISQWVNIAHQ